MAALASRKRPKASVVRQENVGNAISFLEDLPEKTKEELSLREAIEQMQEPIRSALSKGYSYDDIAKMLLEQGIKISALTLKNYAPSGRRQASKAKARQPRKTAGDVISTADDTPAEVDAKKPKNAKASEPEVTTEPRPARSRRGRTKSVAAETKTESRTSTRSPRGGKSSTQVETSEPATKKRRKSKSE